MVASKYPVELLSQEVDSRINSITVQLLPGQLLPIVLHIFAALDHSGPDQTRDKIAESANQLLKGDSKRVILVGSMFSLALEPLRVNDMRDPFKSARTSFGQWEAHQSIMLISPSLDGKIAQASLYYTGSFWQIPLLIDVAQADINL